jgi:hypothetical protein
MGNDPETQLRPLTPLQSVCGEAELTTTSAPPKCANVLVRDLELPNSNSPPQPSDSHDERNVVQY